MRIGFFDHGLSFRGTTRAMHSYAKLLSDNHEVIIFFEKDLPTNNLSIGIDIINDGICLEAVSSRGDIKDYKLDLLYHVTSQAKEKNEWIRNLGCYTILHQVGYHPPESHPECHFAYTSAWQSAFFSAGAANVLPYIIEKPRQTYTKEDARQLLGIPQHVTVLGRHGGLDTWNLPFASHVIADVASKRPDLWFIFLNTAPFCNLPNVRFFPGTHDINVVSQFLYSCDGMIHARWEGETFGLACAEFLIRRMPIITWSGSREKNHFLLADSSMISYNNAKDLRLLLEYCNADMLSDYADRIPLDKLNALYSSETIRTTLCSLLALGPKGVLLGSL